ncbi:hypothetical protein F5X99DRAFT_414807 [Biscogniauxia marginata]|nr:hypothetical protein F5X99DRAFT_414807 [Biscogniauxia marginata]
MSPPRLGKSWNPAGIMGYSSNRLSRTGGVLNRPGMFIMAGFSGLGMLQIFLTAAGLAYMVKYEKSFQKYEILRLFEEASDQLNSKENMVMNF